MNNKTTIASLLLAGLFAANSAQAMDITAKGVKAGLNLGSFSGADSDISGMTKKSRMGIAVGGFVNLKLADKLSLRPEVMWVQKGVSYDADPIFTHTRLSYLDIPLMIQYDAVSGNFPINVFGGVNVGILLTAEGELEGTGTAADGKGDVKADTTTLDYGLQFGAGTVINKMITVDVRYNMGLATTDTTGTIDLKNSGIMITGGYMF